MKKNLNIEGEEKKSLQDILLSTAKVINLRVKSQARGQNNRSIALKWGIVHLCNLNGLGDMIKNKTTKPHLKALDLLFWPLAWLLTLGSIIFAVWDKKFVHFFLLTLYFPFSLKKEEKLTSNGKACTPFASKLINTFVFVFIHG